MISFLLRKMWKNKWMMLCLFVGNILLVGIVAGTPLYSHATMQRILQKDLQAYQVENNIHPASLNLTYNFGSVKPDKILETYRNTKERYVPDIVRTLGIPAAMRVEQVTMENWLAQPAVQRETRPRMRALKFAARENYPEHIELVTGRMPADELVDGYILECLASETTLIRQDLLLDELLVIDNVDFPEGKAIQVKIVGQIKSGGNEDFYWQTSPNTLYDTLWISETLMNDYFIPNYDSTFRAVAKWDIMLDYTKMSAGSVPYYLNVLEAYTERYNTPERVWFLESNFTETVLDFTASSEKLSVTLWVLQVPIYILLAFYIYMVSRQILTLEQNDISVIKSRGASRGQLFFIYTLQGVFVSAVSYVLGIIAGVNLCRMLGASNGFLNMVQRAALQVEITSEALLYGGAAVFLSMLTMLIPVIRFSRVTIVDHKRSKSGGKKKTVWQSFFFFFLELACFGVSVYGLYTYNNQREAMMQAVTDVNAVDPLLYISSSLFIIGMGLLCLRVFPYLIKLVFFVGRRFWPPTLYASLLKVMRSAGEERFIMIFLVFTLAVGIFDAKAARTINLNSDHMIQYTAGTDLAVQEFWRSNQPPGGASGPGAPEVPDQIVWYEPDFGKYTEMEEVDAVAKVMRRDVDLQKSGNQVEGVRLFAVETDKFGDTLWFRDDLLPVHINNYLNALATRAEGILLSDNFRVNLGYQINDVVTYRDGAGNDTYGVVCGFFEHWPGYSALERTTLRSGEEVEQDIYMMVANLGYLQTAWSVLPYEVWMKTNTPNNNFFYEFQAENELSFTEFTDAKANLVESKSDPILQGTNGVLTVGFIVTLLVCFTGFLIFWILSIRSRVLQFGIFRAMGMTMRNIIGLLINEQFFITFTAIGIGALVGEVSSRLFVPLIQISFSASEQVIPLRIVTEARDYANLFGIIGGMIVLCLIVLGIYISRIKIAQALKLGED